MKVVSHSFRPLSGSYISQYIRMMQCFCVTLFPSPIGELHFSIRIVNHLQVQNVFPSPIGELHFSIITGKNEKELFTPVSVPYRGATFLNRYSWCTWWNDRKFPSPIGELHFSIGMSNLFNVPVKVSVPYRGATFLNAVNVIPEKATEVVSVPYRGATFLNI